MYHEYPMVYLDETQTAAEVRLLRNGVRRPGLHQPHTTIMTVCEIVVEISFPL